MIEPAYAIAGAFTGFIVGMTGVGGGALMTPILILVFTVSPVTAVATDLWFAVITKTIGARIHNRSGQVDWQIAKRLWMGSLPTALTIAVMVSLGVKINQLHWLTTAIGLVILITAFGLLIAPKLVKFAHNHMIGKPTRFIAAQPILTIIAGAVLGICVALTSVGAGALGSIMLLYLYPLRMQPHKLVATELVHAIPLAAVAGIGYLFLGMVDLWMLVSLLIGSIPAVILGSKLTAKISGRWVRLALATVLLGTGIKIFIS